MKKQEANRVEARELLSRLEAKRGWEELLRKFVECESPSHDKARVDAFGELVAEAFANLGGVVRQHRQARYGNLLQVDFKGASVRKKPLLLLGHLDTVYEAGTLNDMPCRVAAGRMYGPGVFDMKAGIVMMLLAIEALREVHGKLPRPVTVLLNPDEETGSPVSRPITEKLAMKSQAVLVLEPSAGLKGACKTARKGVGNYHLRVTGISAHAGLDFEKGASAINELARQILKINGFVDLKAGTTVNTGVIRGGTRTNVVASEAEADVDIRVTSQKEADRLDRLFRNLRSEDRRCKVEVSGGLNRVPFERTPGVEKLYLRAKELASGLGFQLAEAAVGGGSDGNFTAGLGIPTLDGLGAVGEGAHTPHESVVLGEIPTRAALLARLIESL
jgi:glutamate carboxypeptidase